VFLADSPDVFQPAPAPIAAQSFDPNFELAEARREIEVLNRRLLDSQERSLQFHNQQLLEFETERDASDLRLADQSVQIVDLTRQLERQREAARLQALGIAVSSRIITRAVERIDALQATILHGFVEQPGELGKAAAGTLSQKLDDLRKTVLGLSELEPESG
jgi:hypothetical protein